MEKTKTVQIKARCTPEFKHSLETLAHQNNTNTSTLIISVLQTFMDLDKNTNTSSTEFSCMVERNILKNTIWNSITIDSTISDKSKERIRKELTNLA